MGKTGEVLPLPHSKLDVLAAGLAAAAVAGQVGFRRRLLGLLEALGEVQIAGVIAPARLDTRRRLLALGVLLRIHNVLLLIRSTTAGTSPEPPLFHRAILI